jgi:hypothetical protein
VPTHPRAPHGGRPRRGSLVGAAPASLGRGPLVGAAPHAAATRSPCWRDPHRCARVVSFSSSLCRRAAFASQAWPPRHLAWVASSTPRRGLPAGTAPPRRLAEIASSASPTHRLAKVASSASPTHRLAEVTPSASPIHRLAEVASSASFRHRLAEVGSRRSTCRRGLASPRGGCLIDVTLAPPRRGHLVGVPTHPRAPHGGRPRQGSLVGAAPASLGRGPLVNNDCNYFVS